MILRDFKVALMYKSGKFSIIKAALSPSMLCCLIYRCSVYLNIAKIPFVPKVFWWLNFLLFKVDLDFRSRMLGGIYMPHPMGIVIGEHVKSSAASRLKIMQGATVGGDLGRVDFKEGQELHQPLFQGVAFLGINSIVVGPLVQKGTVFISANALVNRDVESGLYYGVNKRKDLSHRHLRELGVND